MSSNIEILHPDERPAASVDEKQDLTLDDSSNAGTLKDGDQWRHGIDHVHEKRILRKLDFRLLPFVTLLYLLSFL
jgi:hypothetical protein